jgi:hypothetical protein
MDCIANGCGGYRPCKTKQVQLDVTDAILHFIGDGSALSHLNASNVDFGTLSTTVFPASGVTAGTYGSSSNVSQVTVDQYGRVTAAANIAVVSSQWTGVPGSTIYYTDGVSIGTSADATSNLQVIGNVYVSNALSTTNVFATRYYGDGGLLSNIASQWTGTKGSPIYYVPNVSVGSSVDATANLQVTGNVYVSNTVTVPNVHVTDTFDVLGSMTANAANATFFFDTFTIPYINTQVLNVSSSTTLTGNLVAETANIATLNVGYLTVNSAVVYGATTLNVYGVSNLSTVTANTLSMSGDVFIGNVAITGAVQTTTGPMSRLTFDNTANTSIYPNKIVLYANTASSQYCGFGVTNLGPTGGASIAYGARQNHIFNTGSTLNTEIMRIGVLGTVGIGTASATAKLHVGTSLTQNVQVLVEASNVAIATTGGGRVGFGTSVPTANLHVIGNVYASNAVTTTNVFANTSTLTGTTGQTTLNVTGNLYASNAVTTTNVFANTSTLTGTTGQTTLNVTGNLYVSNALTTTNVFANTSTLTGTTGQTTLNVTGNVYASNAVTTTNLYTAGFTSNATNTIFNFDTLTIPFINSTTLNVASTSNLDTVTLTGEPGLTTVFASGNVYASNALTTTNVFANTSTLTGTTGQTTLNITGNLYVSNALTTTNVFATTVSAANPIPFRNRIINGGMTVWQRNVASISTTASFYSTTDRWCGALGTSGLILSQWPGPTENLQFPYSLQVTTSTATTGTPLVEQRIEYLNIPDFLNGTPVTVSFWAGQPYGTLMPLTVGLYYATAVNNFGTQTLAVAATKNTPTLTAANAYYSLSFTLTTGLAATNGLSLRFTTGAASAVGSTILLTGVQVEKGAAATPFEIRPYATELALAQRYYYQLTSPTAAVIGAAQVYSIFGTATGITTTAFWVPIQFPVPMRTPNYTFSNSAVTNFQLLPTGTTTITSVGVQTDSYTPVSATLNFVGTNIVAGSSYIFRTNNLTGSTTAFFGFSCEL